jgi:hypothetical protein
MRRRTMTTIAGGTPVKGGYYVSASTWEVFPVERDGTRLPGTAADHYKRLPLAAVLLVLPALGGLMVVFLPFIGLALMAQAAAKPLTGMFRRSAKDLAATVTPGWAPGAAHFTGKGREDAGEEEERRVEAFDSELDEVAKEIEKRRRNAGPRA